MKKIKSALTLCSLSVSFALPAAEGLNQSFVEFGFTTESTGSSNGAGLNIKGGTGVHKNIDLVAGFYHTQASEEVNGVKYNGKLFNYTAGVRLKNEFRISDSISVEPFLPFGVMYSTGDVVFSEYIQDANSVIPYYGIGSSVIFNDDIYVNVELLKYNYEHTIHGNILYTDPIQVSLSFGFRF